jgi:hypothetical protein
LRTVFDVEAKKERLKILEEKLKEPNIWKNKKEAIKISREFTLVQEDINSLLALKEKIKNLNTKEEIERFEKELKGK